MENLEKIWEFGRLLWESEYGEDPGYYFNNNETNMKKAFDYFIETL